MFFLPVRQHIFAMTTKNVQVGSDPDETFTDHPQDCL